MLQPARAAAGQAAQQRAALVEMALLVTAQYADRAAAGVGLTRRELAEMVALAAFPEAGEEAEAVERPGATAALAALDK